ncbi:hypothetical protein CYLTODRAFT_363307, partial [Cylindrobasidium torrendii FP15055 ss-10]
GANLQEVTQSSAYKAIKERHNKGMKKKGYGGRIERHITTINLERARYAATDLNRGLPTNTQIWKAMRDRNISKNIQYFMWMLAHDTYKVGNHWLRFTDTTFHGHGYCCECGVV